MHIVDEVTSNQNHLSYLSGPGALLSPAIPHVAPPKTKTRSARWHLSQLDTLFPMCFSTLRCHRLLMGESGDFPWDGETWLA